MPATYTAKDQVTGETTYYLQLTDGPLGGREIMVFEPFARWEDEGHIYETEGGDPMWCGGTCYNIILWYQRPKK